MTSPPPPDKICSACGTAGSGRFCSSCGAPLDATKCAHCEATLSPGAKFCHRCGKPAVVGPGLADPKVQSAAQPTARGFANSLPWVVAAIALLALLSMSAGKFFNARRGSTLDAPQNALPQAGLDDRGAAESGDAAPDNNPAVVRGPDISAMSPSERADRLFNRVMMLNSQGKTDSVLFFAPMALEAYRLLSPKSADDRYDMGRIAEVAGALPLARAQADTILQSNPTHLLGLILAARIASLSGDNAAKKQLEKKFLAVEKAEVARKLPEYLRHQDDISNALGDAQRSAGGKG